MSAYKHEVFDILNRISNKDNTFFDQLSDADLKDIHPLVIMRWLSGIASKQQVFLLNEVVNPYVFSLSQHKRLLIKLLTIACSGKTYRYSWSKPLSKAGSSKPISLRVIGEYFKYSRKHAEQAIDLLAPDDIIAMAHELGVQADELTKLRKELKPV